MIPPLNMEIQRYQYFIFVINHNMHICFRNALLVKCKWRNVNFTLLYVLRTMYLAICKSSFFQIDMKEYTKAIEKREILFKRTTLNTLYCFTPTESMAALVRIAKFKKNRVSYNTTIEQV